MATQAVLAVGKRPFRNESAGVVLNDENKHSHNSVGRHFSGGIFSRLFSSRRECADWLVEHR